MALLRRTPRHRPAALTAGGWSFRIAQVFPAELTDLQHQVLGLLGASENAFRG